MTLFSFYSFCTPPFHCRNLGIYSFRCDRNDTIPSVTITFSLDYSDSTTSLTIFANTTYRRSVTVDHKSIPLLNSFSYVIHGIAVNMYDSSALNTLHMKVFVTTMISLFHSIHTWTTISTLILYQFVLGNHAVKIAIYGRCIRIYAILIQIHTNISRAKPSVLPLSGKCLYSLTYSRFILPRHAIPLFKFANRLQFYCIINGF